ncbi:MAG: hypothetical protein ACLU84_08105 [Clostridia bacterium]
MKIVKFHNNYYKQVNDIYKVSFPKAERYCSLHKLISYIKKGYSEMYCLIENAVVYGFIYSIKYNHMIFILYLAIDSSKRSCGNGSSLLKWYLKKYEEKVIYLNIDKVDKSFSDYAIRKNRLSFYEKNGLYLTNYLSVEKECTFNILSNHQKINTEEYKVLDKFICLLLGEPLSNIIQK